MTTKTITKLDANNSQVGKADEIRFLRQVVESLPQGSYLSSFFSKAMVEWLEDQIRNDFACDFYADYELLEGKLANCQDEFRNTLHQARTEASCAVNELQGRLDAMQMTLGKTQKDSDHWFESRNSAVSQVGELLSALDDEGKAKAELEAQVADLQAQFTDMEYSRDSWKKTAYSNRDNADEVLAALNDERKAKAELEAVAFVQKQDILKLKADLYDLIMNGKEVK
jgi:chromosome segregation ATPase